MDKNHQHVIGQVRPSSKTVVDTVDMSMDVAMRISEAILDQGAKLDAS